MHLVRREDWATIDLDVTNGHVFVRQEWFYEWSARPGMPPWTEAERAAYHRAVDHLIWGHWSMRASIAVSRPHTRAAATGVARDVVARFAHRRLTLSFDVRKVPTRTQWLAQVVKIDPNIDPVTRAFTAYVEIKNDDFRLKPGLSGFARIRRSAENVMAVPSIAIMNPSGEQASVFVVDDSDHATMRKIRPGIVVDAMTEVRDGLKEGEKVVTVGQLYLNNNDKVRATERPVEK